MNLPSIIQSAVVQRLLAVFRARQAPTDTTETIPGMEVRESNWGEWEAAGGADVVEDRRLD